MIPPSAIRPAADGGTLLDCHIQPGASRGRILGEYDGRIKIAVQAPPVDGKANAALRAFLAALLHLPAGRVTLLAGETGRRKRLHLAGISPETALAALEGADSGR